MAVSPVLDENALARLREWGGDKLLGQMIRLFLENAPSRMDQIRSVATGGDVDEAGKGAHSLKSSAANLGAEALRQLAGEIEKTAGEGAVDRVNELLPSIESAFADAITALKTVKEGLTE